MLHDRRIPKRRSNIDHLAVTPTGIWIVDAKNYKGMVERRDVGGWLRADHRLYVDGRDRTALIEGMGKQVEAVRRALDDVDPAGALPIHPALCFIATDWKPFSRPFTIDGVLVAWWKALRKRILAEGPITAEQRTSYRNLLAERLPPA